MTKKVLEDPVSFDEAEEALKNAEAIVSKWGQLEKCWLSGTEDFGFFITAVLSSLHTNRVPNYSVTRRLSSSIPVLSVGGVPVFVQVLEKGNEEVK